MENPSHSDQHYQRYHIETQTVPNIEPWPNRFLVRVNRFGLAKLLIEEIFQQRGDIKAITSRPCMYGVFSGPIGGFAPRPYHCVGCLRCTTQHPGVVTILPNPERRKLGDSYFHFEHVNAVAYEAETGSIPVKGAGYRGKFGGQGWDGMWTDMSEIVRPTRDGIHGREFISTVVDIGEKPAYLEFDPQGQPVGVMPRIFSIPVPFIFDRIPQSLDASRLRDVWAKASAAAQSLAILAVRDILALDDPGAQIVPIITPDEIDLLGDLHYTPQLIEVEIEDFSIPNITELLEPLQIRFPDTLIAVRLDYTNREKYLALAEAGVRIFHLVADFHGRGPGGAFVIDLIRAAHLAFVEAGIRDEVTLIGSGGIVAAEHVPKAIICGLDLVALDTPLLVAVQARFDAECVDRQTSKFILPRNIPQDWAESRIKNLLAAWRDQLLEIMGAMGLREVRRMRGEIGRAMFQIDLEREAFSEIEGYEY